MPRFPLVRIRFATRIVLALAVAQGAFLPSPAPSAAASSPEFCPERFAVSRDGSDLVVPYCANLPLDVRNEIVERAIIVIHGDSRNAADYHRYVSRAAADSDAAATLILAPQFLIPDELPAAGLDATGLYWTPDSWKDGAESGTSPTTRPWHFSSFGVLDAMVETISKPATFPNLSEVVVLGHSAGGQFVNRYSAATTVEQSSLAMGIRIRYVVANPSTLLYLDATRWAAGTAGQFSPLSASQRNACSGFNRYKFGLEEPNAYVAAVGVAGIRTQFRLRNVVYLLGDGDTSTSDPTMSNGCEARWQGASRFERGSRYVSYLRHFYGTSASNSHRLVFVPGVGHDAQAMFRSSAGRQVLFGVPPTAPASSSVFSDIAGHPFEGDITWLAAAGITGGCGNGRFCPNATVTRGQMAAFIRRAMN